MYYLLVRTVGSLLCILSTGLYSSRQPLLRDPTIVVRSGIGSSSYKSVPCQGTGSIYWYHSVPKYMGRSYEMFFLFRDKVVVVKMGINGAEEFDV